jgi:transcriptional regulator with XRE-family HTH domain
LDDSPQAVLREMRRAAGLSQRDLARRAGTSQPAIARYERGVATPSWETLQRLAAACGRWLRMSTGMLPEQHDVELAETLLELTPEERMRALRRYAHLRQVAAGER